MGGEPLLAGLESCHSLKLDELAEDGVDAVETLVINLVHFEQFAERLENVGDQAGVLHSLGAFDKAFNHRINKFT